MADREDSPTPHGEAARRPVVLVISGPIARADIAGLCKRFHALLQGGDVGLVVFDVGRLVDPDVVVVDALARLQLTARRLGSTIRLRDACAELRDLIALTGLSDVMPPARE